MVKKEASEALKEAERKEPLYTFESVCSFQYNRRVRGFPARHSESSPIQCIPCSLSFEECVVNHFNTSNQVFVNLFHRYWCVWIEETRVTCDWRTTTCFG